MSTAAALGSAVLEHVVREHLAAPERVAEHVRHDPDQRQFTLLHRDDELEVWLVGWMPGQDTGFHDHDASGAAVGVLAGAIEEQRLAVGGPPVARRYGAGEILTVDPSAIHRVRHAEQAPAVTVHAYSPPLNRMGQYLVAPDGTLRRFAQGAEEELKAAA